MVEILVNRKACYKFDEIKAEKGNHLANQQTNGVLNTIPSLRFLPLPMSLISHETKSVLRQLLDILEMLSILCISL